MINNTAGYDPATGRKLGHCANANDGTGVFSALDIFSWPSSLQEVQRAFSNPTLVDKTQVADDSAGRGRLWAVAATTIGVTLHELGHCFNLPHSGDRFGIMSRGHDFFNRNFTLIEPPIPGRDRTFAFPDDHRSRFERANAARLNFHPFFQPDPRPQSNLAAPSIEVDFSTGDIYVKAPAGLRALSIERDGVLRDTATYLGEAPRRRGFTRAELQRIAGGRDFALVAIDDDGRISFAGASQLLDQRAFVRSWRLSSPLAWPNTEEFVPVDEARLRELRTQLAARPAQLWFSPFIDLTRGAGSTDRKVAYAYRAIESDAARRVLLLTGSDDTLRVWVNGQLVSETGKWRVARVDEDRTWVSLQRGHNDVIVEVSNVGGGWGFYFRMADEDNFWLHLGSDGSLARLDEFFDPKRFVRAWQFAENTLPWPSANTSIDLAPQREAELRARPAKVSRSPFIDLRAHYEATQPVEGRVAYAHTTIRSDQARELTLLTGSDDTLRVHLNGELVLERLTGRVAQPDDDRTPITLRAGENTLLVEVSSGGGGWGFYLGFAQRDGAPLWVNDDGTLATTRE